MPVEDRVLTTTRLVEVNGSGYPWAQVSPAILARLAPAGMHTVVPAGELRRGNDWSSWVNNFFSWVGNLFNPDKKEWKKTAKKELYYNTGTTQPYKKIPNITQKRIDDILDKINQQGFRFLTEEEKEIFKEAKTMLGKEELQFLGTEMEEMKTQINP